MNNSITKKPPLLQQLSLNFLVDVGLDYLTLSRASGTLSGGESQRIRLASQIGSGLTGVLYVLDEPSIGLHQRDNDRLLRTLKQLRDLGNTVIVVEHDEETILEADHLIDLGPGAGKHGGEVIVLSAGPERAQQAIREALAKGADRGIHVETSDVLDTLQTARMLADAVRDEAADLILTGLQSDDLGFGQTGVVLAELLGTAHSTIIMQVEVNGTTLRVKRELEDGWFQHIEMPLPAVLTIQSGLNKLRYATLMGIKKAKTKEIRVVTPAAPAASSAVIDRVYAPPKLKQAQILTGDAKAAAAQLVEKLKFEARVI